VRARRATDWLTARYDQTLRDLVRSSTRAAGDFKTAAKLILKVVEVKRLREIADGTSSCAEAEDRPRVASRVAQDMMRQAQYSTTARIYQHVASDDMFAAAGAAQAWIEKALAG
jgi:hypothetical protein